MQVTKSESAGQRRKSLYKNLNHFKVVSNLDSKSQFP